MTNTSIYPSAKVLPYVYRGFNPSTGESYIGYRGSNKVPSSADLGPEYTTSAPKVSQRFQDFEWSIVAEFYTASDAYDFEQLMIHEVWKQPGTLNESCYHGKERFWRNGPATGMHAKGMPGTGKNAKGVPKTGKAAKGVPKTGKKAKGVSHGPATGMAAKGVPKTGLQAKGLPKPKCECVHCGMSMSACMLARWHGDNCKLNHIANT